MIRDITASAGNRQDLPRKVVRLAEFGAFVEIFLGTDGLLHISEIAEQRLRDVRDAPLLGDQVLVMCQAIEGNKIRLSRKPSCASSAKATKGSRHRWRRAEFGWRSTGTLAPCAFRMLAETRTTKSGCVTKSNPIMTFSGVTFNDASGNKKTGEAMTASPFQPQ